jgi:hypothetical protein
MKSKITITIGILLLSLTLISAINVYPGETKIIDNPLNDLNITWIIQNNNTIIEGLICQIDVDKINIIFPGDMPPCSFNILFQSEIDEVIIYVSSSSGGSSSSSYNNNIIDNVSGNNYGDVSKYLIYGKNKIVQKNITKEEVVETLITEIEKENKSYWYLYVAVTIVILGLGAMGWVRLR